MFSFLPEPLGWPAFSSNVGVVAFGFAILLPVCVALPVYVAGPSFPVVRWLLVWLLDSHAQRDVC